MSPKGATVYPQVFYLSGPAGANFQKFLPDSRLLQLFLTGSNFAAPWISYTKAVYAV